jgi:hypothetical protein
MSNPYNDPNAPFQQNPYETRSVAQPHNSNLPYQPIGPLPAVIRWQKVYLGFMTVLYVFVIAMGVFLLLNADSMQNVDADMDAAQAKIMGVVYAAMGVVFALLFALGFVFRKGMFGWVYNLISILIGLLSCCMWPACIPLVIFWIKQKDDIIYYSQAK